MTDTKIMAFIIAFWLLLPLPFMYMGIGGFTELNFKNLESIEKPDKDVGTLGTINEIAKVGISLVIIYFQIIFIWVFNMPLLVNIFLWFLRIISGLIFLIAIIT